MEEARRVLDRLDRIEDLQRGVAPPRVLLEEVRALLGEAEEWVRSESGGARAEHALECVREALDRGETGALGPSRTLVA
jgi:hypothetical protein